MDKELLEKVKAEKNELKKMLLFLSWLNKALRERGIKSLPILVGGSAVELYTFGRYTTGDIDLVAQEKDKVRELLLSSGFFKDFGRLFISEELGIFVDIPDDTLAGSYEKVRTIEIPELGEEIRVIGIEDLIIDRLSACVFWKSQTDCELARYLYEKYKDEIDRSYLLKRAKEENIPINDINFLKE